MKKIAQLKTLHVFGDVVADGHKVPRAWDQHVVSAMEKMVDTDPLNAELEAFAQVALPEAVRRVTRAWINSI